MHFNALATILLSLFATAVADPPLLTTAEEAEAYDRGDYDRYPKFNTYSNKDSAPRLLRRQWDQGRCPNGGQYYFVAPHGFMQGHTGPSIFDTEGRQVWFPKGFPSTYNFNVQTYRGEQYLTWWHGGDMWSSHPKGSYFMYDKHYQLFKNITAVNPSTPATIAGGKMDGELHEFVITKDNTAIFTIYQTVPMNITKFLHRPNATRNEPTYTLAPGTFGYLNDALFQEVNVETNELIFQWRASDHISLNASYDPPLGFGGYNTTRPWDWFHINSVEKDHLGNYLISSRFTHALYYIEAVTGRILWQLGGKDNDFTDLSHGRAINIARQHHARWSDDYKSITVFDNGLERRFPEWRSRGLQLLLDTDSSPMTVQVTAEAIHPRHYSAATQGSIQKLPGKDGNLLVGWGHTGAWTEFSADGSEVLCDWQFAALFAGENGTWKPGAAESYRVYRGDWKGYPLHDPDVVFRGRKSETTMYSSWNGATDLQHWAIEGGRIREDEDVSLQEWELLANIECTGFEHNITIDLREWDLFTLTAFDAEMKLIGNWTVYNNGSIERIFSRYHSYLHTAPTEFTDHGLWLIFIVLVGMLGIAIYIWCMMIYHRRTIRRSFSSTRSSFEDDLRSFRIYSVRYDIGSIQWLRSLFGNRRGRLSRGRHSSRFERRDSRDRLDSAALLPHERRCPGVQVKDDNELFSPLSPKKKSDQAWTHRDSVLDVANYHFDTWRDH